MAHRIAVWRERLVLFATATTENMDGDIVPPEQRWYLENVAVKNDTTSNADCLLSIYDGAYSHVLYYFKDIVVGEWASEGVSLWLMETERIRLEWSSVLSGDRLDVHISGEKRFGGG